MTVPIEPRPLGARLRVGVGAAIVLVIVALGSAVFIAAITPQGAATTVAPNTVAPNTAPAAVADSPAPAGGEVAASAIFVHVLGSVQTPGLYALHEGARTVDAVAAAGGFADTADTGGVNLARFVTDGEQLYVPALGEAAPPAAPGAEVPGKVNLNTADLTQLDTLPRVGPAMAERIIQWRDANGGFQVIEDLMSVTGIGQKTFDGLRELVTT
ncbi:ComEA family DNA-binding protein [Salinibacterium sp. ZJ454]|uniref:helix-hairpin-helix domain-containing protein n=1 Tax=Salinibacterium sp. ZJ454 TaxID=2708339 RepID=UPI001420D60D|nr:ComEA family DNA-binding protein [Salinibacterium sp. ZJ454]